MRLLTALIFGTLLAGSLAAQDVRITSSFEPSIMHAGETGIYRFTVSKQVKGGGFLSIRAFDIDYSALRAPQGLQMAALGKNTSINTINSQTMASVSQQFRVRASAEGEYTIPEYQILVDGEKHTVPAATLKVMPGSAADTLKTDQALQLELVLPRDKIYVGESLPVQIRLYVRRDVQLAHLGSEVPIKVGDAFAVSDFSDPVQRQSERNGTIYHEIIWQAVVTPYKAGDYPLVFQLDAYAYLPETINRNRTGNPAIDRFLSRTGMGMRDQQQISLYTDRDDLTVLELPKKGQPADYSGAVGVFRAGTRRPSVDPTKAQVGEPMTLSFDLEGAGNFDRFEAPALKDSDGWRVYNPEEDFAPTDRYRYQGRMTYHYVIIPRNESVTETPEVTFNYFNPDTEKYESITIDPLPVTITPPPPGQRPHIPVATRDKTTSPALARQPELLPIKTTVVAWGQSMRPLLLSPWFLGAQVVPLGILLTLAFTRRRHNRLLNDPRYAREVRARKELKPRLSAAHKAAAASDHTTFYAEAQRVIQIALGRLVEQTAEALSADEIDHLLAERSVEPAVREQTQNFLHAGDALKFGGQQRADLSLSDETKRLEALATQLMKLS